MFSKVDRRKEVHITQHPLCLPASLDWKQQWNYFSPFCRSAWSAAFKIKGKRVGFVSTVKHKLGTELPNTGLSNKYSYFCSVISLLSHWRLCDLILTRLILNERFSICSQTWFHPVPVTPSTPTPSTLTMRSTWPKWTSTALTTTTRWLCTRMRSTRWSTTQRGPSWSNTIRCVLLYSSRMNHIYITNTFQVHLYIFFHPHAWQYPEGISKYDYIPNFTARGLHYDIQKVNYLNSQMSRWRNGSVPV